MSQRNMTAINPVMFAISRLGLKILDRFFKISVQIDGTENIPDGVIIFVVNHFTRLETVFLPYQLHRIMGRPVKTLAHHGLFQHVLGAYLKKMGTVSTRDPNRDKMIIRSLLKGDHPWLIFPEGAMIKDKKVIAHGRFLIHGEHGARRPPHTGAAALALRSEFFRRRLHRLGNLDQNLLQKQLQEFNLNSVEEVTQRQTFLVPVNLSYYPIRSHKNIFEKMAAALLPEIPARVKDELRTEGTMLLSGVSMNISIGLPIAIKPWLEKKIINKDINSLKTIGTRDNLPSSQVIRSTAQKLTDKAMASIYGHTLVNWDHLAAYLIEYHPNGCFSADDLASRLCLALKMSTRLNTTRIHPSLQRAKTAGSCGGLKKYLVDFLKMAEQSGAVSIDGDTICKNRPAKSPSLDFHTIRMANPYQVILNEVEFLRHVTKRLRRIAGYPRWLVRWQLQRRQRAAA